MITVQEAKKIISESVAMLPAKTVALPLAVGHTLAADVFSSQNFPPFWQSAMDGYAFCFADWQQQPLRITGEVQAGADREIAVGKKEAVRIFTGAPLPAGTDTVVMQEKVRVDGGFLYIEDSSIKQGSNARKPGSEMHEGALALEKGSYLSAGAIGFLAGLGVTSVSVVPQPSVALIVTGKELQTPRQSPALWSGV